MNLGSVFYPLIGGALIGLAATVLLLFNGRVTGISGIISAALAKPNKENWWRLSFLAGLFFGGYLMHHFNPDFFINESGRKIGQVLIAGLLVGYGTVMGSGCTSGHGVCGISRLSLRSILATITFMIFGFLTVQIVSFFFEAPL